MQGTSGLNKSTAARTLPKPAPAGRGRAILLQDTGELGNRLVSYAYLLAYSAEHRVPVTNLCFWRYADFFDRPFSFCERAWILLPSGSTKKTATERVLEAILSTPAFKWFRRRFLFDGRLICSPRSLAARSLVALVARLRPGIERSARAFGLAFRVELQSQHQCSLLVSRKLKELPWMDPALPVKHAALMRSQFSLSSPLRERLALFVRDLRARHGRLIGIHIRQGDYSKYRNGQWLFDIPTYRRVATHLASMFPGESVGFLICSNGSVPSDAFADLNAYPAPGHLVLDMYALAACDLIVGPPSTFSGWASFVGEKPIYFIEDAERLPTPAELTEVWSPRFY